MMIQQNGFSLKGFFSLSSALMQALKDLLGNNLCVTAELHAATKGRFSAPAVPLKL
jgi:hypothetical protein